MPHVMLGDHNKRLVHKSMMIFGQKLDHVCVFFIFFRWRLPSSLKGCRPHLLNWDMATCGWWYVGDICIHILYTHIHSTKFTQLNYRSCHPGHVVTNGNSDTRPGMWDFSVVDNGIISEAPMWIWWIRWVGNGGVEDVFNMNDEPGTSGIVTFLGWKGWKCDPLNGWPPKVQDKKVTNWITWRVFF